MHLRGHIVGARAQAGAHRQTRRWRPLAAAAVAILPLSLLALAAGPATSAGASSGGTVTYTATINIPAPPASSFTGAGAGGDGWAVALSSTQIFNVFHHNNALDVNCHEQSDASECPGYSRDVNGTTENYKTITGLNGGFYTEGMPGLYLDQSTGRLYVFAIQGSDSTGGVVCIDTTSSSSNPFCGFTPLTATGQASLSPGWSEISDPVEVGGNWYAFNYVPGSPTGTEDELLCFSLTSFSACSGQPFAVNEGTSSFAGVSPAPGIGAFNGEIVIPNGGSPEDIGCYDPSAGGPCPGSWPIGVGTSWGSGPPFPELDSSANTIGFCLPSGTEPCYNLDGTAVGTPANLASVIGTSDQWNGPAVTIGPRVYVPNGTFGGNGTTGANGNNGGVACYDYSANSGAGGACANFNGALGSPITFNGLGYLYTVNVDPNRPTCLWVNSDDGPDQIQDFDAFTGGACGQGPIRLLASDMVAPSEACTPAQWTSLQITNPYPPGDYGGGSVTFENADGATLTGTGGTNPAPLSPTGSVDLTPYNFSSVAQLPDFLITLESPPADLTSVTVQASWQATDSQSCVQPGTSVAFTATASPPVASYGNTVNITETGIPAAATGTVTFTSGGITLCSLTLTGQAGEPTSCTTAVLPAGAYPVTGTYLGDSTYAPATATTAFAVNFIASASPTVSNYGTTVTLSESGIDPAATGPVTFSSGGQTLCSVTLTGKAGEATSCTVTGLYPGTYQVTATYPGDASHGGSSATTSFVVNFIASASPSPQIYGKAVSLSESGVSPTATGLVTFSSGGNTLCSVDLTGLAGEATSCLTSNALAPATYLVTASYAGDESDLPATASTAFTVVPASQVVKTTVGDEATGGSWAGTELPGAVAFDTATVSNPVLTPTGAMSRGQSGPAAPTGTVTFDLYGNPSCVGTPAPTVTTGTVGTGGVATSPQSAPLGAGHYSYQATYSGDTNYQPATGSCEPFTVGQASTTEALAVLDGAGDTWGTNPNTDVTGAQAQGSAGIPDPADSNVSLPTPTGEVTYSYFGNGTCTGTGTSLTPASPPPDITGGTVAYSLLTSALAAGAYSMQAVYTGDSNYTGSTSACEPFTVSQETPAVGTIVDDASTYDTWSGSEVTGASAYDTSTVTGVDGFAPTGTVTYQFFSGSGESVCSEKASWKETVALGDDSQDTDPLGAGTYYFDAVYSGDSNYNQSTSSCEYLKVNKATLPVSALVSDVPPGGLEQAGSQATDALSFVPVPGFAPSGGVVNYTLYTGSDCAVEGASVVYTDTGVALGGDGTAPVSTTSPPLPTGTYSYLASYTGTDPNYVTDPAPSVCSTFSVGQATPVVSSTVEDTATQAPWAGTEVVGASAFDTATVTGAEGIPPTGRLSFALYGNGTCAGDPLQTWPPPVTDGGLGGSSGPSDPLPAGAYSFLASYGGDSNYSPASSTCEPFSVGRAASLTSGAVYDAATHKAWAGTEHQGASAYDAAAVRGGLPSYAPSGSLTYSFFSNGTCAGTPATTQTVSLSGGAVPVSANTAGLPPGAASYLAAYSGDAQLLGSQSPCQPFTAQVTGYRLMGGDGGLFAFRNTFTGSAGCPKPPGLCLHLYDFVGMAPAANGYWMVQSTGGVLSFGSAAFHGSLPQQGIKVSNIVGIAATPDFGGYWMVSSTGAVYSFGNAHYHGGTRTTGIVAIVSPDAGGYWLVGSNGAVYPFGDAKSHGGCTVKGSGCVGATNIVGMASPDAGGYWLVSRTGGVFTFGDAHFRGACPSAAAGCSSVTNIVGIASPDASGYWLAGANGAVYHFGDALFLGNEVGAPLVRPMVAVS